MFSPEDDRLLKPREMAEMLGVRATTVGFWARTGVLKAAIRTPGGQRRYRHADVAAVSPLRRRKSPRSQLCPAEIE
jgi:DNA-binding transcriptional MerR regulator